MKVKIMSAYEAVGYIKSGSIVATDGFIGGCFPEELAVELERRFLETGNPRDLTLVFCAGQGDSKEKGLNHLGHENLLSCVIGGHWGLVPKVQRLALENKIEAYNLPQGVISHLFRDIAAKKPGVITSIGLGTFVDPRQQGGKVNSVTKRDIVELIEIGGVEYLLYKSMPIDVALLRGTYADENGNITMHKEGFTIEAIAAATAAKNSGGIVIVQVERVVKAGTLDPRLVKVPGILVDIVVVASKPEYHMQTFGEQYNPAYTGEAKVPLPSIAPMQMSERKIICRRAAMELRKGSVINLGIGMPEGVSSIANEEGIIDEIALTVEAGPIGGIPASGLSFGCSANPEAIIDQTSQFDFYHGGGLNMAFLGLAQVDKKGNLNVSKFGDRIAGCGGFIDITQSAKEVVFCGTLTAGGLEIEARDGKLKIIKEGKIKKFLNDVEQITFSSKFALKNGQKVLYITERAVFELKNEGLILKEIAPGIDLKEDVLDKMEFMPVLPEKIELMDKRLFVHEKMGLGG